jgi:glutaredoxin
MNIEHVDGKDAGKIMLYTLSTCVWCKKTKALLKELGVAYDYIDVDLLNADEEDEVVKEITKFNPNCSFPTAVIDGKKCIVGFKEDEIREAIKR